MQNVYQAMLVHLLVLLDVSLLKEQQPNAKHLLEDIMMEIYIIINCVHLIIKEIQFSIVLTELVMILKEQLMQFVKIISQVVNLMELNVLIDLQPVQIYHQLHQDVLILQG